MWFVVLTMIGVIILTLIGGMMVFHQKARGVSEGQSRGMQHTLSLVVNRIVSRLLRGGVPIRIFGNPVVLLTVPGRKTGQPRTTLVDLYEHDGRRFLVSTHGEDNAHWVHNLRAAGKGTLVRGRTIQEIIAVELTPEAAGLVLKEVLGPRLASLMGGFALRQTLEVASAASLDDFISTALHHPVFELDSPPRLSRANPVGLNLH